MESLFDCLPEVSSNLRKCRQCFIWKSPEDFHPRQRKCKACHNLRSSKNRLANLKAVQQYDRTRGHQARTETITAYGGKCACCGETTPELLTIDHINGGGRRLGEGGSRLPRKLKRLGFPEGYRLLCANCNCSLGMYGYCPHSEPSRMTTLPPDMPSRINGKTNRAYHNVYAKQWNIDLKITVIAAYGGACKCCGETQWEFLTIDHIQKDGKAEMAALGRRGGKSFYIWLRQQGFPQDRYRLLCFSCNLSLGSRGYCPHGLTQRAVLP